MTITWNAPAAKAARLYDGDGFDDVVFYDPVTPTDDEIWWDSTNIDDFNTSP